MTKNAKYSWLLLAAFMLIQLGASYLTYTNQNNLGFLMEMKDYIPFMFYFSLLGFILFGIAFMASRMDVNKAKKETTTLTSEINTLKAKLFDMQEAQTNPPATAPHISENLPTTESPGNEPKTPDEGE